MGSCVCVWNVLVQTSEAVEKKERIRMKWTTSCRPTIYTATNIYQYHRCEYVVVGGTNGQSAGDDG
jgi:hypothetical protein